jgi:formate hydrogenlyase subunit 3/multisubunit Na+/H+ antiporter MnhD subunit
MTATMGWVIVVPFAGACLAFLAGRRATTLLGLGASGATLATALVLGRHVWQQGPARAAVGGWPLPLGISLYADGLTALMVLMTAAIGVAVSVYAAGYFAQPANGGAPNGWSAEVGFWPLWLFLWGALNALFLSADLFNLYVALELLGLSAVGLIVVAGEHGALTAAMRYLLAAFLGSLAYLLGVALLYAGFGSLDLLLLGGRLTPGPVGAMAAALIMVGLLLKTALFPLHFWLPQAHANALAPVSAVLSGLVVKGSFYLVVRLWFHTFLPVVTPAAAHAVGWLGAAAILWGAFQAARQSRLKMLIAHSTVSQIGYLFLWLPLATGAAGDGASAGPWAILAWNGGMYQAVAHAFAKAALFMAAGTIMHRLGHDRIAGLRGVGERLPMTMLTVGVAGVSLMGVPPSAGFVAKAFLLRATIGSGQWWWALLIVAGGLLAAVYLLRVVRHALASSGETVRVAPPSRAMDLAALALALCALALGLRAAEVVALLEVGRPLAAAPGAGD